MRGPLARVAGQPHGVEQLIDARAHYAPPRRSAAPAQLTRHLELLPGCQGAQQFRLLEHGAAPLAPQGATQLHIADATVKSHMVHVFSNLEMASRTAAVARARALGAI
jgi:hypothetical protein